MKTKLFTTYNPVELDSLLDEFLKTEKAHNIQLVANNGMLVCLICYDVPEPITTVQLVSEPVITPEPVA